MNPENKHYLLSQSMRETHEQEHIYDELDIKNKSIEPDNKPTSFANRNLQLGKIKDKDLKFLFHKLDKTVKYSKMPFKYGGWITKILAKQDEEIFNLQLIVSGSVDGFVREMNATTRKINDNRIAEMKAGKINFSRQGN